MKINILTQKILFFSMVEKDLWGKKFLCYVLSVVK